MQLTCEPRGINFQEGDPDSESFVADMLSFANWSSLVGNIAGTVNPTAGHALQALGATIISFAAVYYAPSPATISAAMLAYGNLINVIAGSNDDPDAERQRQLLQAFKQIDDHVADLGRSIVQGFQDVNERLRVIEQTTRSMLEMQMETQRTLLLQQIAVADAIARVGTQVAIVDELMRVGNDIGWEQAHATALRDFETALYDASHFQVQYARLPESERQRKAAEILATFVRFADVGTQNKSLVGSDVRRETMFRGGLTNRIEIDPISDLYRQRGVYGSVGLSFSIANKRVDVLRNPGEFVRAVQAGLDIPAAWPSELPRLSSEQRSRLAQIAREVMENERELRSPEVIASVLGGYKDAWQAVLAAIVAEVHGQIVLMSLKLPSYFDLLEDRTQFGNRVVEKSKVAFSLDDRVMRTWGAFPPFISDSDWVSMVREGTMNTAGVKDSGGFSWFDVFVSPYDDRSLHFDLAALYGCTDVAAAVALGEVAPETLEQFRADTGLTSRLTAQSFIWNVAFNPYRWSHRVENPSPQNFISYVDYFSRPTLSLRVGDAGRPNSEPEEWCRVIIDNIPEAKQLTYKRVRGVFFGAQGGFNVADADRMVEKGLFPSYQRNCNNDVLPAAANLIRFGLGEAQVSIDALVGDDSLAENEAANEKVTPSKNQLSGIFVNVKERSILVWVNGEQNPRFKIDERLKTNFPSGVPEWLQVRVDLPGMVQPFAAQRPQLDDERAAQDSFLRYCATRAVDFIFADAVKEGSVLFEALRELSAWRNVAKIVLMQGYGEAAFTKSELLPLLTSGTQAPDATTILRSLSVAATSHIPVGELLTQMREKYDGYRRPLTTQRNRHHEPKMTLQRGWQIFALLSIGLIRNRSCTFTRIPLTGPAFFSLWAIQNQNAELRPQTAIRDRPSFWPYQIQGHGRSLPTMTGTLEPLLVLQRQMSLRATW